MDPTADIDIPALFGALALNMASVTTIAIGVFYTRYRRKDLAVVFWFFNVCLFLTVRVIQMTQVAAALGFGLFAILSIIRLRSEPFSNREIGYFFGALVIGLLNGIGTPSTWLTISLNLVLLVSIYVLDHPLVMQSGERRHIVLDRIETDPTKLRSMLEERLGVRVTDTTIVSIDFIRDAMQLDVTVRPELVASVSLDEASVR